MILPAAGFHPRPVAAAVQSPESGAAWLRAWCGRWHREQRFLWTIFLNASLVNNFVLAYFLGICPFLGVSGKLGTATRMGGAVCFVMLVSSVCAYGIHRLLVAIDAPYLQLISYIVVIASTVQLVEMFIKKISPPCFGRWAFSLPLITTNCAILALALFQTNKVRPAAVGGIRARRRQRFHPGADPDGGHPRETRTRHGARRGTGHRADADDRRYSLAGVHGLCGVGA